MLPPLLLVLTLGVNPHFSSSLVSLLLSSNLTTATFAGILPVGRSCAENFAVERFVKLENE